MCVCLGVGVQGVLRSRAQEGVFKPMKTIRFFHVNVELKD